MYLYRVNVPMGGTQEVHTSLEVRRRFSYANVRKASYRGIKTFFMYILTITMISVFKFCVIGGIFLHMFADAVLFDMMLKTAYEDGIDNETDLIERHVSLGKIIRSLSKLLF